MLECSICGTVAGPFPTYEEWEDYARLYGWYIASDDFIMLCPEHAPAQ